MSQHEGQLFVEIRPKPPNAYTEAFVLTPVSPKDCRSLILRLNEELPLPKDTLCHLKRVRKDVEKNTISMILFPKTKGIHHDVIDRLRNEGYQIVSAKVPARLPETADEWSEFNAVWPTKYVFTASSPIEMPEQKVMLEYLIKAKHHGGVIIVDPHIEKTSASNSCPNIIATADQEAREQGHPVTPLATNVLLAIQGVSRIERKTALDLPAESNRQHYLCTNYDVYCTKEPSVFECMALLHSRIRRLVFAEATEDGGITDHMIHALQLTNHRYRAFSLCKTAKTAR